MTDWSQKIGYNNIINLYSPCIRFVKDTVTCVSMIITKINRHLHKICTKGAYILYCTIAANRYTVASKFIIQCEDHISDFGFDGRK